MKKILFTMVCAMTTICASAQDSKLTINAGFLFPSTLNATIGYEYPLSYGNAVEVFGELGNQLADTGMTSFLERLLLGWRSDV